MKKFFLIPVFLLIAGKFLAQSGVFVNDEMVVKSKTLFFADGGLEISATGKLDNHGNIELNGPFKNAGENNFILRYNGEYDYGQFIMKSVSSVDGLVLIEKNVNSVSNYPIGLPFNSSNKPIKIYKDENYNQPLGDTKFGMWNIVSNPSNPNQKGPNWVPTPDKPDMLRALFIHFPTPAKKISISGQPDPSSKTPVYAAVDKWQGGITFEDPFDTDKNDRNKWRTKLYPVPNTYTSNIDLRKAKNSDQIRGTYITVELKDKNKGFTYNTKRYVGTLNNKKEVLGDVRAFYLHPLERAYVKMKSAVPLTFDDEVKTFDTEQAIPSQALSAIDNTSDNYLPARDGIKLELPNGEGLFLYASDQDQDKISDVLASKLMRQNPNNNNISTLNENYPVKGDLYINLTPKRACPVKLKLTRGVQSTKKEDITVTESTTSATEFFLVDLKDNKVEELFLDKKLSLEFPEGNNKTQENRYALSFGRPNLADDCWKTYNTIHQVNRRSATEKSIYRSDEHTISVNLVSVRKSLKKERKNFPKSFLIEVIDSRTGELVHKNNTGSSIEDINAPLLNTSSFIIKIKSPDGKTLFQESTIR